MRCDCDVFVRLLWPFGATPGVDLAAYQPSIDAPTDHHHHPSGRNDRSGRHDDHYPTV
jgi:hypothetical protein